MCERVGPPSDELWSSGSSYVTDVAAEVGDFLDFCPCVEPWCVSWDLVHGTVGQGELFPGDLFHLLEDFEGDFPRVLSWLQRVEVDTQTFYARGAPIKGVRDEAGGVVLLEFVKMNAALGCYCLPVHSIMNYSPDSLKT